MRRVLIAAAGWATVVAGATRGSDIAPPKPDVREITVSPAPELEQAGQYRLRELPADQIEGDGASLYLRACMLMDALPREELINLGETLEAIDKGPPTDAARGLAGNFGGTVWPCLLEAHRRTKCEWVTTVREEGMTALLPELGKFRMIARLLALRVKVQLADGQRDEALQTIRVTMELGTRLGRGPTLIHALVGAAVCAQALNHIQLWIQQPGAPNLYWALSELPEPLIDLREPIRSELSLVDFTIPEIRKLERGELGPKDAAEIISKIRRSAGAMGAMLAPPAQKDRADLEAAVATAAAFPRAREVLLATGKTPAEIDAMPVSYAVLLAEVHDLRVLAERQARWASRPAHEAVPALFAIQVAAEEAVQVAPSNLLLQSIPSTARASLSAATLQRWVELLRTAEALRMYAATHPTFPSSLDQITAVPVPRDPLTLAPFQAKLAPGEAVLTTTSSMIPPEFRQELELRVTLRK